MYSNKALRLSLILLVFLAAQPLFIDLTAPGIDPKHKAEHTLTVVLHWFTMSGIGALISICLILMLYRFIAQKSEPLWLTCIGVFVLYSFSVNWATFFGYGGLPIFLLLSFFSGLIFLELNLKCSIYISLIFLISLGISIEIIPKLDIKPWLQVII